MLARAFFSPVSRHLFVASDDAILRQLHEDNQRIEPEWYCPIVPTVLLNGAEGIGTGWSTKVPNFDPRQIVAALRRMLNDEPPQPLVRHAQANNDEIEIDRVAPFRFATDSH